MEATVLIRRILGALTKVGFVIGAAGCGTQVPTDAADVVYMNGRIYTVNETQPWAEAVAIKGDKFIVVGSNADAEAVAGGETRTVDLDGRFAMPGIVDMHAHPFTGVDLGIGSANLSNPGDLEAVLADVKAFIDRNPDKDVILGGNWLVGGALDPNDSPGQEALGRDRARRSRLPAQPKRPFVVGQLESARGRRHRRIVRESRSLYLRSLPWDQRAFRYRPGKRHGAHQ